jgi:hypothetical protein
LDKLTEDSARGWYLCKFQHYDNAEQKTDWKPLVGNGVRLFETDRREGGELPHKYLAFKRMGIIEHE